MPDAKLPEGFEGSCDARFGEVPRLLAEQVARGEHHGVSFAAFFRGEKVIDVWGGQRQTPDGDAPWQEDTMALCWSTTKGVAATALHMVMDRREIGPEAPVASVWPEFGCNGKDGITIAHVLSHEAGVPQIRDQIEHSSETADWDHMVGVMEGLEPLWEPGTANGYHAINYGWLVGETLRRIDGRDVPTFLAEELAGPLGLDGLYIGTPPEEQHRIAPAIRGESSFVPAGGDPDEAYDARIPNDSILWKALGPRGKFMDFLNSAAGISACIPSVSGVFTARSLATVYAALERRGEVDGVRILSTEAVDRATRVRNTRPDLVIMIAPHWRLGYMSGGAIPVLGPNFEAYGHVGAGGTYAAADPKAEIAFALVYDKFGETELLGAARGSAVAHATVAAAEAAR
jgi:CubicO group peptidase (beta-lactamase class C family)